MQLFKAWYETSQARFHFDKWHRILLEDEFSHLS